MYKITVESTFSSAHNLRGYRGKCEALHGHNWKVEVSVTKDALDKTGMVLDFKLLKGKLNKILDRLDHRYLNDLTYFKKVNPTSENIAEFIFKNLRRQIPAVSTVIVWENNTSYATYEE
jgi:6-pyruvoyltetrahydropterin/6-carboxytetrahydropterin synthase